MRKWWLCVALLSVFVSCNDGVERSYWENGNLKSELRYVDGKLEGDCVWYTATGGLSAKAHYKNDVPDGPYQRWHPNGKMASEENYVDGVLEGEMHKWYDNGQLFQEGQYASGMMDGQWLIYYPSGALAGKADYKMGTGKQIGYEESGYKCLEVPYVDNVKHGREIYYNPDGRITKIVEYDHGKVVFEDVHPSEVGE